MKFKKPFMVQGLMCYLLFYSPAFASVEASSTKIKADLEEIISKVIPSENFLVNVSIDFDTVSEKRISEGETFTQNNPNNEIKVPPLPGFEIPTQVLPALSAGQTRQSYKMVDKEVLKDIKVAVNFDKSLDQENIDQSKELVKKYLDLNFGAKAILSFATFKMTSVNPLRQNSYQDWFNKNWLSLALFLLFLLSLIYIQRSKTKAPVPAHYPRVLNREFEEEGEFGRPRNRADEISGSTLKKPMALPSRTFPSLPATEKFIDGRTELLQSLLRNADIFRVYFGKLSEAAQLELYSGLRGPGFDSLLESLNLSHPKGNENTPPPSEEQMLFYQKNFDEFIDTNSWQNAQFFGFLKYLTPDQLTTLLRQENPVVAAVVLKFSKPADSASALSALSSKERSEILAQFYRAKNLSAEELSSIELTVREKVARLPRLLLGYNQKDAEYWSQILSFAENQEELLLDLERLHPDLYPTLAKFRFKLEDIPSLPSPLVQKVFDEVDNEELALALLKCPKAVVDFSLNELGLDRRKLISSQLSMFGGMPSEKILVARQNVTLKFREVMQ